MAFPTIPEITAAIAAATSAVGLFDKITDQIERFITKKPQPQVPKKHRMEITGEVAYMVVRYNPNDGR